MLDTSDPSFADDLETFDSIPTRNHNTVFVFYLKADQSDRDQVGAVYNVSLCWYTIRVRCQCSSQVVCLETLVVL